MAVCVCVSNMESLKLWIALTPEQLEELNKGNEVFPDEYSGRFVYVWDLRRLWIVPSTLWIGHLKV